MTAPPRAEPLLLGELLGTDFDPTQYKLHCACRTTEWEDPRRSTHAWTGIHGSGETATGRRRTNSTSRGPSRSCRSSLRLTSGSSVVRLTSSTDDPNQTTSAT